MLRYFIGIRSGHGPAVLLHLLHISGQLLCQFPALYCQHQLSIHICAAQVHIIGADNRHILINHHRFPVIRYAAVIFQNLHTGIKYLVFPVQIIAGCHKIVTVFYRIDDHSAVRYLPRDLCQFSLHVTVQNHIRSMDDHSFFCLLHKFGKFIKQYRLLPIDSRWI